MKKVVNKTLTTNAKPITTKQNPTTIPKEYYVLRDDVYQFLGVFKASALPQLDLVQEAVEI